MNKFLTVLLALTGLTLANVDRPLTCGAMTALPPFAASAIVCPVTESKQGIATDDTVLFLKTVNGTARTAYSATEFTAVGGKDSVACYITGQRRDSDDVSVIFQMLYKFPGQSAYTAAGGNDTLTFGAAASTQRRARALLPGLPFIPIAVVSTATDSMGVLGAYCHNK